MVSSKIVDRRQKQKTVRFSSLVVGQWFYDGGELARMKTGINTYVCSDGCEGTHHQELDVLPVVVEIHIVG